MIPYREGLLFLFLQILPADGANEIQLVPPAGFSRENGAG